jgi:iron complex outermembrane receptor protein
MPRSRFHLPPLALALALGSTVAYSQTSGSARAAIPVQISIAVQPLAQALNDLAQQARLELMVQPALVAGKTAPAVSGRLTPQQALDSCWPAAA